MKRDFRRRKQGAAPSFSASNESADSWCRHGRHYFIWQRTSILFGNAPRYPLPLLLPHGGSRLGSDGGKADGGLKATAAGTVCLQTRAVARRRFQPFGRRHRNRSGGFCCFSPSKSREKRKNFLLYFWGQKYQKPPHVVFRGSVRSAALHGARKIKPMRHPVTDAPQPAPSFSASNESADLLCRQRRHYYTMRSGSPYQLTCPARLRLRVTFVSQNQPPSQLHFFFFRKAIPDLVPMAKKRTEG